MAKRKRTKKQKGAKPLTRRQQMKLEKKKLKLEKLKQRKSVKLERVKQKGASGYWSADAVKARQETVQKGIAAGTELAGDVAGAVADVYGGGLLSAVGDALGGEGDDGAAADDAAELADDGEEGEGLPMPWIIGGVGVLVLLVIAMMAMKKK